MAADVAIEAIQANDTSDAFLKSYDEMIRAHPIIQWVITNTGRWNLRKAQDSGSRRELRSRVHYQFGFGILTHAGTPLVKCTLQSIWRDPLVIAKWVRMFCRYYYNWEHERFGLEGQSAPSRKSGMLGIALRLLDAFLRLFGPLLKIMARLVQPLAGAVNPLLKGLGPVVELVLRATIRLEPVFKPLTHLMTRSVTGADPAQFDVAQ
jgi:hypothetical protein